MLNHILVPTDGSPSALIAAQLAACLCGEGGRLTLLNVHRPAAWFAIAGLDAAATVIGGVPSGLAAEQAIEEEAQSHRVLDETRRALPDALAVESLSEQGRAQDVVLDRAAEARFDSVAVGSRGRGPLTRALLGSVSDAVLRGADKPVLVGRHVAVRRILVGIDGSPQSMRAAEIAAAIARRTGAAIGLIAVVELPLDSYAQSRPETEATFRRQAEELFQRARAGMHGVPASDTVAFDDPAHAMLTRAAQAGVDLIVLGRRGRGPTLRGTIGSVALRVALHADASVLVVP